MDGGGKEAVRWDEDDFVQAVQSRAGSGSAETAPARMGQTQAHDGVDSSN